MKSRNLTWLRFQLSWCSIELIQGVYTWTALDDAVAQCNAAGIKILYTIRGAPTWALTTVSEKATTEPFFLPDPTLTAGFATQVATRYNGLNGHGKIDAFGYNEDFNIHFTAPGSGWAGTHASTYQGLYGDGVSLITVSNKWEPARDFFFASPVVKAVYPAIKAVSNVPVGGPCIWWTQPVNIGGIPNTNTSNYTACLSQLYADGCKGFMDFADLHYYSNAVSPTVGSNQVSTLAQGLADMQAVIAANGDTIKIACTEIGWQVNNNTTGRTNIAPGSVTITLDSTNGATVNGSAIIDTGASQETVSITGKTATTITATFANSHTQPYPVVILLDCDAPTQNQRYYDTIQAALSNGSVSQFFFFTLDYTQVNPSQSSLVFWNGSSYTYSQALTTLASFSNPAAPSVLTGPSAIPRYALPNTQMRPARTPRYIINTRTTPRRG